MGSPAHVNAFQGRIRYPPLQIAIFRSEKQERVRGPPLKIVFYLPLQIFIVVVYVMPSFCTNPQKTLQSRLVLPTRTNKGPFSPGWYHKSKLKARLTLQFGWVVPPGTKELSLQSQLDQLGLKIDFLYQSRLVAPIKNKELFCPLALERGLMSILVSGPILTGTNVKNQRLFLYQCQLEVYLFINEKERIFKCYYKPK